MLIAFGVAKRRASNEQQYDIEERQLGTDTEEMMLACWFAGTNWFLKANLFDIWKAQQALEQGIKSTIGRSPQTATNLIGQNHHILYLLIHPNAPFVVHGSQGFAPSPSLE